MKAPQVLLVPGNPLDLTEEKLQELIEDLNTEFTTEYSSRPMGGRGVTWWEVLAICLATKGADALIGHATVQAVDQIVYKVRRWVRRRRSATESKRPFYLELRDDEGNIIRAIEFSGDEEVDVTEREREKGRKPPPEIEP